MAMLAEPRKKSKFRLQPFSGFSKTNKRSDEDTSSFGYKMMAGMGWAPGKGLGLNETGNIDPIKLRFKNDDAGLGYKVSENDALAQQSEFQALLHQLNLGSTDTDGDILSDETKNKSKKPKIKSLEKQSERSSKRVHYKKFTRSKDLSRASEQDLRSILGLSSKKPKVKEPEPEPKLEVPAPNDDTTGGFGTNMYFTAGSSVDYFKKRFQEKKSINKFADLKEETTSSNSAEDEINNSDKNKRRSVTWGEIDVSYVDKYIKDMVDTSGGSDELLYSIQCYEEPPTKKKKKKKNRKCAVEISEDVQESVQLNTEKKKKRKLSGEENSKENVAQVQEDYSIPKKKKKRKGGVVDLDEQQLSEASNCVDIKDTEALCSGAEMNSNEEPKRKKKKKKNQVAALPEQDE